MSDAPLLDYVVERLEAARGSWPEVVKSSGVPMSTLDRIARRATRNPGVRHVEALARYFREKDAA